MFNSKGWRDNSAQRLNSGDRVVLVGTWGDDTAPADQNRVLGMMEPSNTPVSTADFPLSPLTNARHYKPDGSYRWPFGLLNYRAWEFEDGLFLDAVAPRSGNPFGSAAAAGIVPLNEDEARKILAHPHHEVALLKSFASDKKLYGASEARRRGAPTPADGVRRSAMHMRRAPAYVYWFRLVSDGKVKGHKIGWAFDWEQRLKQFNSISLSSLGGIQYKQHAVQHLATARLAFSVEQQLLRFFDGKRHRDNREVLSAIRAEDIKPIWENLIVSAVLEKPFSSSS